jgi:hypothetical protein
MIKMTTQVMERIIGKLERLDDEGISLVLDFIDSLEENEPNAETIAAFKEAEHLENLKSYPNIEEMFREFGVNVDC